MLERKVWNWLFRVKNTTDCIPDIFEKIPCDVTDIEKSVFYGIKCGSYYGFSKHSDSDSHTSRDLDEFIISLPSISWREKHLF